MPIEIAFKNNLVEWVDVIKPTKEDLKYLNLEYKIDPLLLEDTLESNHLPKYEEAGDIKFFLTRENTKVERRNLNNISDVSTKLGIFLISNYIITIHRIKNPSVIETKAELETDKRKNDISRDQIALRLALKIIKSYDDESLSLQDRTDALENEIFLKNAGNTDQIKKLYHIKKTTGLNIKILHLSSDWINQFKNLKLKKVEVADLIDKQKDVMADFDHLNSQITNLISIYIAISDQKANQVMKMLSIYSVYFLPITFLAGVYGMNFKYMPELETRYGYYITLAIMALIVFITFIYLKKIKKF